MCHQQLLNICALHAGDLEKGGPVPIGAQKANLSDAVQMYMEEVALNEQVHAVDNVHGSLGQEGHNDHCNCKATHAIIKDRYAVFSLQELVQNGYEQGNRCVAAPRCVTLQHNHALSIACTALLTLVCSRSSAMLFGVLYLPAS